MGVVGPVTVDCVLLEGGGPVELVLAVPLDEVAALVLDLLNDEFLL